MSDCFVFVMEPSGVPIRLFPLRHCPPRRPVKYSSANFHSTLHSRANQLLQVYYNLFSYVKSAAFTNLMKIDISASAPRRPIRLSPPPPNCGIGAATPQTFIRRSAKVQRLQFYSILFLPEFLHSSFSLVKSATESPILS